MSDDRNLPAPLGATGRATPLSRVEAIAAGQYWRTKADIPERIEEYERDEMGGRFGHQATGRMVSASRSSRRAVSGDTVLLIASLNYVDGDLHRIDLAAHPLDADQSPLGFLVDEFLEHFEPAPDAKLVRESELASLAAKISEIQAEIIAGPPNALALPAPDAVIPDVGSLVAVRHRADEMKERVDQQLVAVKARATFIAERSKQIGKTVELQARFYQEQVAAAEASVETQTRQVQHFQKGLRTLSLYTGEEVETLTVADGEQADRSEPLTIYQRRLYLDEELGIHAASGGMTYKDIDHIERIVAKDPSFIDRILPAKRSVALMRLRRRDREFNDIGDIASALQALAEKKLEKQTFLVARNGDRLTFIWSDHLWSDDGRRDDMDNSGLTRLFPSRGDGDAPFRGYDGRRITPESLDYTEARRTLDDHGLVYKRMLMLLWGLQDRTNLFGDFYDRGAYESWLDPDLQADRFRFVADDEMGLIESRQSVGDWIKQKNAYLQSGSRVACLWDRVITEETSSGCYNRRRNSSGQRYREWSPISKFDVAVVRRKDDGLIVQTDVRYVGYKSNVKDRGAAVDLTQAERYASGYLCLDAVNLDELDRYVESRRDREHYLSYLELFVHARTVLREERKAQAHVEGQLVRALTSSHLVDVPQETAVDAVRGAIRLWRARNRGVTFPENKPQAFKEAMAIAWTLVGLDQGHEKIVDAICRSEGRTPLRLVVDGAGTLVLYASQTPDETIDLLGEKLWAARIEVERTASPARAASMTFASLDRMVASEALVREWPEAAFWIGNEPPDGITYQELKSLVAAVDAGADQVSAIRDGDPSPEFFLAAQRRVAADSPKGYIHRNDRLIPVGIAYRKEYAGVLVVGEDPMVTHARGSDEAFAAVRRWIMTRYKLKAEMAEELSAAVAQGFKPLLAWVPIFTWRSNPELRGDNLGFRAVRTRGFSGDKGWKEQVCDLVEGTGETDFFSKVTTYAKNGFDEDICYMPADVIDVLDEIYGQAEFTPRLK